MNICLSVPLGDVLLYTITAMVQNLFPQQQQLQADNTDISI